MPEQELPPDVQALIDRHIATIEHVEVLVLLARDPAREWRVEEIANALHLDRALAGRLSRELASAELCARDAAADSYRYPLPASARQVSVATLVELYERRPVAVVRAIHNRPLRAVRSFADAFRLLRPES